MFYSFFNLPVELDDLRAKIKSLAGIDDEPQLLLRIGYGAAPKMDSPRRLVKDVLKGWATPSSRSRCPPGYRLSC